MNIYTIFLALHIAGGTIGLSSGSLVLALKKGSARHVKMGTIYFWSMLTAALTSFILAVMHPNYFLFIVGVFSAYLVLTGKQYISMRNLSSPNRVAWLVTIGMLIFSLLFIGLGIYLLNHNNTFGMVPIVFGFISLLMVFQDYRNYTGKAAIRNFWLTTHLQRMTGGYIASATAFLVVNNSFMPEVVAWLLPTVILTPLIFYWTGKYRAK